MSNKSDLSTHKFEQAAWLWSRAITSPILAARTLLRKLNYKLLASDAESLSPAVLKSHLSLIKADTWLMRLQPENISITPDATIDFYESLRSDHARAVVYEIPRNKIRGRIFHPLTPEEHPHIYILRSLDSTSNSTKTISELREKLHHYYTLVPLGTIGETLGFLSPDSPIFDYPYATFILPWIDGAPEGRLKTYKDFFKNEAQNAGIKTTDERIDPSSNEALVLTHSNRLYLLLKSMEHIGCVAQRRPYVSGHGNIGGHILVNNTNEWSCCIVGGQHRAAVAGALDQDSLPIVLQQVVHRRNAAQWPQVQRGTYTIEEALEIFDRIMEGRLPQALDPWVEYVRQNMSETE